MNESTICFLFKNVKQTHSCHTSRTVLSEDHTSIAGNTSIADVNFTWSQVYLIEEGRGRFDTERKRQCDHTGRDRSDVATSQRMPAATRTGRGEKWVFPKSLWNSSADTLISAQGNWFQTFGLSKCDRLNFSYLSHQVCGNLLQEPHEMNTCAQN